MLLYVLSAQYIKGFPKYQSFWEPPVNNRQPFDPRVYQNIGSYKSHTTIFPHCIVFTRIGHKNIEKNQSIGIYEINIFIESKPTILQDQY